MTGSESLLDTGLCRATLVVPAGARNGGRGLPNGFSRFATLGGAGVPSKSGFGSTIGSGCICMDCAAAEEATYAAIRMMNKNFMSQLYAAAGAFIFPPADFQASYRRPDRRARIGRLP